MRVNELEYSYLQINASTKCIYFIVFPLCNKNSIRYYNGHVFRKGIFLIIQTRVFATLISQR